MTSKTQVVQAGAPIRRMALPALGAGVLAALAPVADQLVWALAAILAAIIVVARFTLGLRRLRRKGSRAHGNTTRRGRKPAAPARRNKVANSAVPRRRPRPKA